MAEVDDLVRFRDAALKCNGAAKNALALLQWTNSEQGVPLSPYALPLPRGQTLPGRLGEPVDEAVRRGAVVKWTGELQKALEDWSAAVRLSECLEQITRAAVSLHLPHLQIGIDSFATAHEAAQRRATELLYFLDGRQQSLSDEVRVDLHGRIEAESLAALELLADKKKQQILTEPLTQVELSRYFACHRNQVRKLVLDHYYNEKVGARYRLRVQDMPADYRAKHGST